MLGNLLKMWFMLLDGRVRQIKDIARELEVSERQVKRYKEELAVYVDIESITGKYGGYRLRETYIPFKGLLTEEETELLRYYIDSLDSFPLEEKDKINKIIGKINYSILNKNDNVSNFNEIIPYSTVRMMDENRKNLISDIYKAIVENREVDITYKNNNGKCTKRKVQPYKYITYKGEKYLVAYCLMREDIRYFKMIRIQCYKLLDSIFNRTIDIDNVINQEIHNSVGIFGGKEYKLVLEVSPPMANTISERIWVEDQCVEELEQGEIRFTATMKGGPEIISWILSMGDTVKVIEPLELKDEIGEKLKKMIRNL
ncbi:putative transcriptional regulator [Clostridium bornimense]|uniref:Putative transcriptional regulator n=1 Tax=Clostridium bornimense TaxID=1216932 RepID=W6SCP2_9CLOT|nr:WYL domain-containing protein [Clostridium bornimense]CDM67375.1 putative transcriptional regulator [Clostridium bornimense]